MWPLAAHSQLRRKIPSKCLVEQRWNKGSPSPPKTPGFEMELPAQEIQVSGMWTAQAITIISVVSRSLPRRSLRNTQEAETSQAGVCVCACSHSPLTLPQLPKMCFANVAERPSQGRCAALHSRRIWLADVLCSLLATERVRGKQKNPPTHTQHQLKSTSSQHPSRRCPPARLIGSPPESLEVCLPARQHLAFRGRLSLHVEASCSWRHDPN